MIYIGASCVHQRALASFAKVPQVDHPKAIKAESTQREVSTSYWEETKRTVATAISSTKGVNLFTDAMLLTDLDTESYKNTFAI